MANSNHFDYFGVPLTGNIFKIFENLENANIIAKESELAKYVRQQNPNKESEIILGDFFDVKNAIGYIYFNSDGMAKSIIWSIMDTSVGIVNHCIEIIKNYYGEPTSVGTTVMNTYSWDFRNGNIFIMESGGPHGLVLTFTDKINDSVDSDEDIDYENDDTYIDSEIEIDDF